MNQFDMIKEDSSKSELFELSAEFSNDSSQLEEATFGISNLELDVIFGLEFKLKKKKN